MPVTINGVSGFVVTGFGDDFPGDTTDNTVLYLKFVGVPALALGSASRTLIGGDVVVKGGVGGTPTGTVTVTPVGTDGGTVTRTTGSWVADGFIVGQLVMIQGLAGQWRLVEISADGKTLTLRRGDTILPR